MITSWELYLWTRLDVLTSCLDFGFILLVAHLFYIIVYMFADMDCNVRDPFRFVWRFARWTVAVSVFLIVVGGLTPSKKDAAMIWVIPKLATVENVEALQGEAAEIYNLAKQALKESVGVEEVRDESR